MWDTVVGFRYIQFDINVLLGKGWIFINRKELYKSYLFFNKNNLQLFYYPLTKLFMFKLSIPNFLYGTNTMMAYEKDIPLLDKKFRFHVLIATNKLVKSIKEFNVSRIDFCYNFFVQKPEHKQYYIDAYKKSTQSYLNLHAYESTAFFVNKSSSVKFYDKSAELEFRNIPIEDTEINNILRFEVEYKRDKIKYLFGKNIKLKDLLKDSMAKKELNKYLDKIFPDAESKSEAVINEILNNRYKSKGNKEPKMKTKLVEFMNIIKQYSVIETSKILKISTKTILRYIKTLTELGINPFISHTDIKIKQVLCIKTPTSITYKYYLNYTLALKMAPKITYYHIDGG